VSPPSLRMTLTVIRPLTRLRRFCSSAMAVGRHFTRMLPDPRHLASSEGSWSVAEWLLDNGSNINALDRFKRTPLEVRRLQCPQCVHGHMTTPDAWPAQQRGGWSSRRPWFHVMI
jgi:Ankyrin repeat